MMTEIELLVDQFKDLERQGPGSDLETEKALDLIGFSKNETLKVLDIGCGTGRQTLTLARHLNGHITAVDLFPEFLERLDEKAMDLEDYWLGEYPEIDTVSNKLKVIESNGFGSVAHFILPEYCWMDNYYLPLEAGFSTFLSRHENNQAARDIIEGEKRENEMYKKFKGYYSYGFYIAKYYKKNQPDE